MHQSVEFISLIPPTVMALCVIQNRFESLKVRVRKISFLNTLCLEDCVQNGKGATFFLFGIISMLPISLCFCTYMLRVVKLRQTMNTFPCCIDSSKVLNSVKSTDDNESISESQVTITASQQKIFVSLESASIFPLPLVSTSLMRD